MTWEVYTVWSWNLVVYVIFQKKKKKKKKNKKFLQKLQPEDFLLPGYFAN